MSCVSVRVRVRVRVAEGEMKDIVANHLATPESAVEPVAEYNPTDL